jgi:cytochrome bd-type quinol oxidase subunit 2
MKKVSFYTCRKRILRVWLWMSFIIILIFLLQTVNGKYNDLVKEVWQWLFQYILPPITLMIGVFISQSLKREDEDIEIDNFYFQLSYGISIFFLLILFLAPFSVPYIHLSMNTGLSDISKQKNILDAYKVYDNFILPIQGIMMLCLGMFFTQSK